jgi:hypothetical protein
MKILCDELDLADFILFPALGGLHNREKTPSGFENSFFEFRLQTGFASVRVSRADDVVNQAKKERAVARTHQLFRRFGLRHAIVEWHAAGGIRLPTLAGAQRSLPFEGDFIRILAHERDDVE